MGSTKAFGGSWSIKMIKGGVTVCFDIVEGVVKFVGDALELVLAHDLFEVLSASCSESLLYLGPYSFCH